MESEKSPANRPSGAEHRRSSRFPVIVPLEVAWREPNGAHCKENAQATEVNAHGAFLQMQNYPAAGVEVELTNRVTRQTARARMAAIRRAHGGEGQGVAVELLTPSESFWGVNFQLRKTSAELLRLERAMKSGDIDASLLREFRDAVDYVRKTAWAVQEWQERQIQHRDPQTVLSLLTLERIRRTTQLTRDLFADLNTHGVSHRTEGVAELHRAIEALHEKLAAFVKRGEIE